MPKPNLAIVIPAYRARYLSESLNSLAEQSCHEFRVYVADDGSPESLAGIVDEFVGRMDLVYRRFPENLGRTALVRHWDRAIRLSGEPWVWLFSDDDVADAGCVAALTDDLRRDPSEGKLRRFDLEFIDDRGRRIEREPVFPDELASPVYVEQLLTTLAPTCVVQNMVFSRAVYEAEGGFDDFPGGYCSDCCTWPRFARHGGLRRIRAPVRFRRHGGTLTATTLLRTGDWSDLIASYAATIRTMRRTLGPERAGEAQLQRKEIEWFCRWFRFLPRALTPSEAALVAAELRALWPDRPVVRELVFGVNYAASRLRRNRVGSRLLQIRRGVLALIRAGTSRRAS